MNLINHPQRLLITGIFIILVSIIFFSVRDHLNFNFYNGWLELLIFRLPALCLVILWFWFISQISTSHRWGKILKNAALLFSMLLGTLGIFSITSDIISLSYGKGLSDDDEVFYKNTSQSGISIVGRRNCAPFPLVNASFSIYIQRPIWSKLAYKFDCLWYGFEPPPNDLIRKFEDQAGIRHSGQTPAQSK